MTAKPTSLSVLVLVAALLGYGAAHGVPDNACTVGGPLEVYSTPDRLPATAAQCDVIYKKEDWQLTPTIIYTGASPHNTYTLFMIDPDAPDRPPGIYYLHYIVANIPGKDFQSGDLSRGTILCSYQGPAPPAGTGLHRYMFYVYHHVPSSGRLPMSLTVEQAEREFFNLSGYMRRAARQGVQLRGPLSGVQFRSAFRIPAEEQIV